MKQIKQIQQIQQLQAKQHFIYISSEYTYDLGPKHRKNQLHKYLLILQPIFHFQVSQSKTSLVNSSYSIKRSIFAQKAKDYYQFGKYENKFVLKFTSAAYLHSVVSILCQLRLSNMKMIIRSNWYPN